MPRPRRRGRGGRQLADSVSNGLLRACGYGHPRHRFTLRAPEHLLEMVYQSSSSPRGRPRTARYLHIMKIHTLSALPITHRRLAPPSPASSPPPAPSFDRSSVQTRTCTATSCPSVPLRACGASPPQPGSTTELDQIIPSPPSPTCLSRSLGTGRACGKHLCVLSSRCSLCVCVCVC